MIVMPAIDLKDGKCVRLVAGRMETAKVYDADPLETARRWEAAGARWIHVVDLDGAFGGRRTRHWNVVERIAATVAVPVQFGGGIRAPADARTLLDLGVGRVIIGTLAAKDPAALEPLFRDAAERVAIGLDARDGVVLVEGWERATGCLAVDLARDLATLGARRFVYTDVARDGTLTGPNLAATRMVAEAAGVPVTASGGVSSLDDLLRLRELEPFGVDSVIVGKALYEGRFTLEQAMEAIA